MAEPRWRKTATEWPTLLLVVLCYLAVATGAFLLPPLSLAAAMVLTTLAIALHSSLQHEILHGHPFQRRSLNEALVFLPVGLFFPYGRFRDLHLAHHRDEHLTDPYDDPESNFQDPAVWAAMPRAMQVLLVFNNTLLGRMAIGPAWGMYCFVRAEIVQMRAGNAAVIHAWRLHLAGLLLMAPLLYQAAMPVWAYVACAYLGMSILKIRTFLEHRAHDLARARSVVIERGGVLGFLFLNNHLHAVHHARPGLAWYRLPASWRAEREQILRRNDGYAFGSYGEIARRYLLRPKDPVPHPLRPRR